MDANETQKLIKKWTKTVEYPRSVAQIQNAKNEQIMDWWRFLPPATSNYSRVLLIAICREFNKRFRYEKTTAFTQ